MDFLKPYEFCFMLYHHTAYKMHLRNILKNTWRLALAHTSRYIAFFFSCNFSGCMELRWNSVRSGGVPPEWNVADRRRLSYTVL